MKIKNYKVSWKHNNHNDSRLGNLKFSKILNPDRPKNGSTECFLVNLENPDNVIIGKSVCQPNDNYDKRLGRYLSFQRAVKQITEENKRRELWNEMLSTGIITKEPIKQA